MSGYPGLGRVLLVHSGALGDFILALRVVAAIRAMGASGVTILGRPHIAALATLDGQADRILDFDTGGFHALFDADSPLPDRVVKELAGHYLSINMAATDHSSFSRRLAEATGGPVIDVDPRPRAGRVDHITEQWFDDLAGFGIDRIEATPTIRIERRPSNRRVILHPGSGGRRKCWPIERFVELANELALRAHRPEFLVGPVERETWSADDFARLEAAAPLIQGESLLEVARLLAAAGHVVANDSGIAHLAAAVGTRLTAIFGPTDPRRWQPLGDNVVVVAGEPWPDVRAVLATIEQSPPRG